MLRELQENGIVKVAPMPRPQALAALAHLDAQPRWSGHVKRRGTPAGPDDATTCWSMADVLAAPHLLEFALAHTWEAGTYLGRAPRMYSVNAFETRPAAGALNPDIQEFHRDRDDVRFLALFVYLTDVLTPEQGAHEFQRGTHTGAGSGEVEVLCGVAGTAFLADTSGLHRGLRPSTGPRVLAWARWGVSDLPASYDYDVLSPVPREALGKRYPEDAALRASLMLVAR